MAKLEVRIRTAFLEEMPKTEFTWNLHSQSSFELYSQTKYESLKKFLENWNAFLNQFVNSPEESSQSYKAEVNDKIKQKTKWLSNELGWNLIIEELLNRNLRFSEFTIISEPKYINLPFEILELNGKFLGDELLISRKLIVEKSPPSNKKGTSAFFVFDDMANSVISSSTTNEKYSLDRNLKKKLNLKSAFTSSLRSTRFKEEISNCELFHFAGHIENNSFIFKDKVHFDSNEIKNWNLSNLNIAFLNGCHALSSITQSESIGIAMIHAGVKSIVGFSNSIPTKEAEEVGVIFWNEYFNSNSIEKSINRAKENLKEKGSPFRFTLSVFGIQSNTSNQQKVWKFLLAIAVISLSILAYSFRTKFQSEEREIKSEQNITENKKPEIKIKTKVIAPKISAYKEESKLPSSATIPTSNSKLRSEIEKIQLNDLKEKAKEFLSMEHPIYNRKSREDVLISILLKNVNEKGKLRLLLLEMKSSYDNN